MVCKFLCSRRSLSSGGRRLPIRYTSASVLLPIFQSSYRLMTNYWSLGCTLLPYLQLSPSERLDYSRIVLAPQSTDPALSTEFSASSSPSLSKQNNPVCDRGGLAQWRTPRLIPFCFAANASSDSLPHDVERNAFFCDRHRCVISTKRCITRFVDKDCAADHRDGYYKSCWPVDHWDLHQC